MSAYSLIQSNINGYDVFGIKIETENGSAYEYKYISAFYEEADELLHRMTKDYISPVHFDDIVTDYLVQLHYKKLTLNGLI